ncbi:hypothetical protein QBC40DRAFT_176880 [Triangularia verruculosa]|uniref:Carrier domain-containing protein n=1 Tax=Triangularia verruculosa TaxID=2587418 RepID=A0AAN7AUL9_9PEZI|nr:hypothetical protein QBC40DRAFT_176880 [Triangularia verruculosa]
MSSLTYIVDQLAAEVPHDTWVKIPSSSSAKIEGITWQNFTFQQLSQAVNRLAYWIDEHLGPAASDRNEPLAYTGVNDIRYPIVILAALKTGYKQSLLLSPRNSVEGHCALVTSTNCTKLLYSQELSNQAHEIGQKLSQVKALRIPDLDALLTTTSNVPHYHSKCGDVMPELETAMILHSSGTTGLPKPIPVKAGVLAIASKLVDTLPTPESRLNTHDPLYTTPLILSMPPFFHAFGMNLLVRSLYYRRPLVLLPSSTPPTAELMLHAIRQTQPTAMVCTPSILEDICGLPHGLDILKSSGIQCIYSGGAPLARSCGDLIAENLAPQIRLVNGIGTTEIWNATSYIPTNPKNWEYFEWNPASGIVMEAVDGNNNIAELVIRRMPEGEDRFQFVFYNFPELQEWRTKDLFERHPVEENLWRYVGRVDDIIVLSNGEKLNPVTFEKMVEGHPLVKGTVLVGSGQFQTGLIVEVHDQSVEAEVVIEQIWESVEEANEQYPAHAKVWRSMVAVARADKPFERTPKGTVMRRNTYRLYQAEIKEMYAKVAASNGATVEGEVDEPTVLDQIRKALNSVTKRRRDVTDDSNLFALDFDSLQVLQLILILKNTIQPTLRSKLSPRLVYENPSISQLCRALCSTPSNTARASRSERFDALIKEYTPALTRPRPSRKKTEGFTVILTGSTGTLGSNLLTSLLANPVITHIYCLNRSKPTSPNQPRVTYLQTDPTHPTLGLPTKTYRTLKSPSLIIHAAWPVNFNLPLDSFLPSLTDTANLMSLSPAKFIFISSIATAMNNGCSSLIPETFTQDHNLPLPTGYGESKYLASCILANSPIPSTILRVGQLAGRSDGAGRVWNKHEWLPSLVQTSLNMGAIPRCLGGGQKKVDWIPVDLAAEAILELGLAGGGEKVGCYNVVNPSSADWEGTMVDAVQAYAKRTGRGELKVVGVEEWLDALAGEDDAERFPALKLKEFFEGWRDQKQDEVTFETHKAGKTSRTMREMEAVSGEMMGRWLDAWAF